MITIEDFGIDQEVLPYCCGIRELGDFCFDGGDESDIYPSGTGLYTAAFIDDLVCKEVYKRLCDNLVLLYQSPVRKNVSTNNNVFFCVFSDPKRMGK